MEQQLNLGIVYFPAVNSVIIWGGLKGNKKHQVVLTLLLSRIFLVTLWPKRTEHGQQIYSWKWGYVSYSITKENKVKAPFLIWKRIKCFPSTLRRRNLKTNLKTYFSVFEENSDKKITWLSLRSSFSKSSVFKTSSVHTKVKSQHFHISPVWRTLSKSFVFVTD